MNDINFLKFLLSEDDNSVSAFLIELNDQITEFTKIDKNSINDLFSAKKKVEDLISKINDFSSKNESFNTLIRLSEIFSGENIIDELNNLKEQINNKIEDYKKTVEKNDEPKPLNITGEFIKNCLSKKILNNKKSNDDQTNQLCNIIAGFLNTGEPCLKNTKEDYMKINAASNLLFGFADYTLFL